MEQVGIAGFRCSETFTVRVAVSAGLIVEEHLPESSHIVVALEGHNVKFPSEL